MSSRSRFRVTVAKLVVFAVVSVVFTTVVVATLLNLDTKPTRTYRAVFANASGLQANDIVAIAGVQVGAVGTVRLSHDRALVSFSVDSDQHLTTTTQLTVGFENLLGNRFLMLSPGHRPGRRLPGGSLIPVSDTHPGLDLTTLFDGFQPLFAALTPQEVNQLTASIIEVFQNESGNLSGLLSQTAALTENLANRGTVIDEVIDNLTPLLHSVSDHDRQLGSLIDGLDSFVSGLSSDRGQIAAAISSVGNLTSKLSSIFGPTEQPLSQDISGLSTASAALAADQHQLGDFLGNLTPFVRTLTKVSDSGNYLSVYICNLTIHAQGTLQVQLVPGVRASLAWGAGAGGHPSEHTANCR